MTSEAINLALVRLLIKKKQSKQGTETYMKTLCFE